MKCPNCGKEMKDIDIIEPMVTIRSTINEESREQLLLLAENILKD